MEIGRKCPYGEALDKPIKCQRPDGGNEFITHNNNKGHLQHQVERMSYNHVLLSVLHKMFYWHFLPVEECALANKKTKHSAGYKAPTEQNIAQQVLETGFGTGLELYCVL